MLLIPIISTYRVAQEKESARAGLEEKVQEKLRLLDVREKGALLDTKNGEEAVVLLVRHSPGLFQHLCRRCGTLQPAPLAV